MEVCGFYSEMLARCSSSDTLTDLRCVGPEAPPLPPFTEIINVLTSDLSCPNPLHAHIRTHSILDNTSKGTSAGAGEAGGIGEEVSENVSHTVQKDTTDPLFLTSSPPSPPFDTREGDNGSTTTRGGGG